MGLGGEAGPAMDMDEAVSTGLSADSTVNQQKRETTVSTSSPVLCRGPESHRQKENPRQLGASQRALNQKSEVMGLNPRSDASLGRLVRFSNLQFPHLQNGRNTYRPVGLQED